MEAITNFLAAQKEEFLEKKIASELKGKKNQDDDAILKARAKFQTEADNKYNLTSWLEKIIAKAKPNITTHPAKFTNAKIKSDVSSFIFLGQKAQDGYVKTGNVNLTYAVDVSGDAATNTIIFELYQLLSKNTSESQALIHLFESDNDELKAFITNLSLDYEKLKDKALSVFFGDNTSPVTHELIRQVYFPIEGDYHLLSITTASSILFEVKTRIDAFDKWIDGVHIRNVKKENKFHADGFDELLNITEIGFSHNEFTKMGNVSYLNVRNKGIAYLLPSTPPTLQKRDIRLPTNDFFKNSLWRGQFKENFEALHKLMISDINNITIRQGIINRIKFIIDQVLEKAFAIRAYSIGWSSSEHYKQLPLSQLISLDDIHLEQRENQELWLETVSRSFAGWIVHSYEASVEHLHNKKILSSTESSHIRQFIEEAISQDKEFF